jgi:regulator of sigma E protease
MQAVWNALASNGQYLLAFLIVFTVIVFAHEFGHFLIGRLMGIRVEVFSFGMGKRLFGVKRGHTDYRVSLLPVGGYVKFLGEGLFEKDRALEPDDFMAKKRWQRFLVIIAGALMNIVLAVVLMAVVNMAGVRAPLYQDQKPVIGWIEPGSPAQKAGLQPDDELQRINGRRVATWTDVELAVGTQPDKLLHLDIIRQGRPEKVELRTEKRTRYDMGYAGFFGKVLTEVLSVVPGSPAAKGGLKAGDIVLRIEGQPVYLYSFSEVLEANPEKPLALEVRRSGRVVPLTVTPRREGKVGKIGIVRTAESVIKKFSFFPAFDQSVKYNLQLTTLVLRFLKGLFTGEVSARQVGGPLEIARISGETMKMGFLAMISWIALFSLQLGILNLVPIPVLDGGQLFVLTLEGIFRRDFGPKLRTVWMQIGFFIFVLLLGFIILNDIMNRLPKGWGTLWPF